ncbi:MAG: carboxypeptidase regulatory-like domain-containing protein [Vicinamibacteraceae bacterium]
MSTPLKAVLLGGALACTVATTATAQATFGIITGRVIDESSALLPGVTVVITNQATNTRREAVTDEGGNYAVTHLNAGVYTVTAALQGFKSATFPDVRLDALATVRIDIRLEIGALAEEVVVDAAAPVVDSETPTLVSVRSNRALTDLPMNIRGGSATYQWSWLTPTGTQGTGSSRSFGGGRSTMNNFNIDGISAGSPAFGNELGPVQAMREAVEEVRFEYASSRAEFGGLSNVTAITRSGGNELHGSGFWTTYPSGLVATDFFAADSDDGPSEHLFGGSVGGPIVRNRAFFFAAYEGYRREEQNVLTPTVPTLRMRRGDFSELLDTPAPIVVHDPLSDEPFPDNVIPAGRLNQGALAWQNRFYPEPNFGSPTDLAGNYRGSFQTDGELDQLHARVDHRFSSSHSIYGRFSVTDLSEAFLNNDLPPDVTGVNHNLHKGYLGSISHTWTLSSRLVNEARFGWTRRTIDWGGELDAQEIIDMIGLQGLPNVQGVRDFPLIAITGFQDVGGNGLNDDDEWSFQWIDQLSYVRGRHLFKTGVEIKPIGARFGVFPGLGEYEFTDAFTGYSYADFLLGLPQTTLRSLQRPEAERRAWSLNLFVQDDFKLSPRLTLNYGLRWEYSRPAREATGGLIANFDPATSALVVPDASALQAVHTRFPSEIPIVTAADAGFPRALREHDLNNFAPRLGFAFRPFGGTATVIRGGYGIFYDELTLSISSPLFATGPFGLTERFVNRVTDGAADLTLQDPFLEAGTIGAIQVTGVDRELITPRVQQWNLTVEQDIGFRTSLRLSYLGTKGTELVYQRNVNQPPASPESFSSDRLPYPNFDQVLLRDNGGRSLYNAVTMEVQRRMHRGLEFQAAWTWAKHLTDAVDTGGEGGGTIENAHDLRRQRGNAQFTPRHRLVATLIWELPFGSGRRYLDRPGVANHVVGGWQVSALYMAQTGLFLTPSFSGADPSNTLTFGGVPDRVCDGNLPADERTIDRWFDASCFAVPPNGRFGSSGFGILEGPGRQVMSLGLFKRFPITGRDALRLEITATNVFNRTNYDNPELDISAPGTVGTISSSYSSSDFAGPREVAISLRYQF